MTINSENHRALLLRVNEADTVEQLKRIEQSCERLYEAGCLTPDELANVDDAITEKLAELS